MEEEFHNWLPSLIYLKDYNNRWEQFLGVIYSYFQRDFIEDRTFFRDIEVCVREDHEHGEKSETFWHIISEGISKGERVPSLRRCERIRWPKAIIECKDELKVKIWENDRGRKGQTERRFICALEDFSYIVVLAFFRNSYQLVTAYCIGNSHGKRRLKKEYEIFAKKRGLRVSNEPRTLSTHGR